MNAEKQPDSEGVQDLDVLLQGVEKKIAATKTDPEEEVTTTEGLRVDTRDVLKKEKEEKK